ncbi:uncharacterized protein STEHIDRAFT_172418 [Stereum hirsutum FP-91666 SS1]|uniref:uncharacterized protein n=1 Tax=Stereum hirsutum (strain FP-91666) TaxID=721885 RepID=UPI00044492D6|nr:uncharacterized protein STEHIDRAFT_172418 [Stereum hirsutum FP-91666 SS1]EIM80685.1 hypothetical protein STEHIDRAFT_172418 [Stereum hirsutum FP-91666 SS1]
MADAPMSDSTTDLRSSSLHTSPDPVPSSNSAQPLAKAPVQCSRRGCKKAISPTENYKLCLTCRENGRAASRRAAERKAAEAKNPIVTVPGPSLSTSPDLNPQEKRPASELDSASIGPPAKRKKIEKPKDSGDILSHISKNGIKWTKVPVVGSSSPSLKKVLHPPGESSSNIPEYGTSADVYQAISHASKGSTRLESQSSYRIVATDPKVDAKTRMHAIATELRQSTPLRFSSKAYIMHPGHNRFAPLGSTCNRHHCKCLPGTGLLPADTDTCGGWVYICIEDDSSHPNGIPGKRVTISITH